MTARACARATDDDSSPIFTLIGKESHAVKSELLSAVTRGSPLDPWCALLE